MKAGKMVVSWEPSNVQTPDLYCYICNDLYTLYINITGLFLNWEYPYLKSLKFNLLPTIDGPTLRFLVQKFAEFGHLLLFFPCCHNTYSWKAYSTMLIHAIYSAELYRHIASRLRYSSVSHPSFELEEWQHPPASAWMEGAAGRWPWCLNVSVHVLTPLWNTTHSTSADECALATV